jgi:hypothetical protein
VAYKANNPHDESCPTSGRVQCPRKEYDEQRKSRQHRLRYHEMEEELGNETGEYWTRYGDWGVFPVTLAKVAQAGQYEGHGFEEELGKMPRRKRCRIRQL